MHLGNTRGTFGHENRKSGLLQFESSICIENSNVLPIWALLLIHALEVEEHNTNHMFPSLHLSHALTLSHAHYPVPSHTSEVEGTLIC